MNNIVAGICAIIVCVSSVCFMRCKYKNENVNAEIHTYEINDSDNNNSDNIEVEEND